MVEVTRFAAALAIAVAACSSAKEDGPDHTAGRVVQTRVAAVGSGDCAGIAPCPGYFVQTLVGDDLDATSSNLVAVTTEIDEYGSGWQSFFIEGWDVPILRRLTVGGMVEAALGPIEVEYEVGILLLMMESFVAVKRSGELCAVHVLEPASVFIDNGYQREIAGGTESISVKFGGFTGEVVNDEPDDSGCVQYKPGTLVFDIGGEEYEVAHDEYRVTDDWVIAVDAALRFVEGCIPAKFSPNVQYTIFRRKW